MNRLLLTSKSGLPEAASDCSRENWGLSDAEDFVTAVVLTGTLNKRSILPSPPEAATITGALCIRAKGPPGGVEDDVLGMGGTAKVKGPVPSCLEPGNLTVPWGAAALDVDVSTP